MNKRAPSRYEEGYICAVANILRLHDETVIARYVLNQISPNSFNFSEIADKDREIIIKSGIFNNNDMLTYREVCHKKGHDDDWIAQNVTMFNPDLNLNDLPIAETGEENEDNYVAYEISPDKILMVFEKNKDYLNYVETGDSGIAVVIKTCDIG